MTRGYWIGIVLWMTVSVSLGADPLAARVSPETAAALLAGKEYRGSLTGKDDKLQWAPSHELAAKVARSLAEEKPDLVVESLYLWKKPRQMDRNAETLAVYNILSAVSSLQGIEYWSASRGKMRLFYEESWRVVSPEDRTKVPDRTVAALPGSATFTVWQKDLSFGGNLNRLDYFSAADGVLMESTNLTRMSYGIVPVAAPGALKVRILVMTVDEGELFWVVSSANVAIVPGVRGKLEASFGNRAEAVYRWFTAQAEAAWKSL